MIFFLSYWRQKTKYRKITKCSPNMLHSSTLAVEEGKHRASVCVSFSFIFFIYFSVFVFVSFSFICFHVASVWKLRSFVYQVKADQFSIKWAKNIPRLYSPDEDELFFTQSKS